MELAELHEVQKKVKLLAIRAIPNKPIKIKSFVFMLQ